MNLKNKTAIVTGASRGIGKAIAEALAREGVHLALIARSEEGLTRTEEICRSHGVMVKKYPFDLTRINEIPELLKRIKKEYQTIDILVNDAGRYESGDPFESKLEDWDYTLDLNFRAVYHLTNQALELFPSDQEAGIINICSISGLTTSKGGEIYNSSKHALKAYAGCLFESIRERGIKVTNIYPGYVNTGMVNGDNILPEKMIQPEDIASAVSWALSVPENACPTDITIRPQRSPYRSNTVT
jgi:NADP-dependent 3-hydroxy acid dehydrogenase YdfG